MNPKRPVLLASCGADQIPSLSYGFDTSNCWGAVGSQPLWVLSGGESCFEQGYTPSLGQLHPKTTSARGREPWPSHPNGTTLRSQPPECWMRCPLKLHYRDFPRGPLVKNPPGNAGDLSSVPGLGTRIPHAARQLSPHTTTEI